MYKKILLQLITLLVGGGLISYHLKYNIGITFMMAGIFFVYIAFMTFLLDLSHVESFMKGFLNSKILWGLLLLIAVGLIIATTIIGIISSMTKP